MEDNSLTTYNITSNQVAQLLKIHVRSAQRNLKKIRKAMGKSPNAYVSVQEFCTANKFPEDEVLKALESIYQFDPDSK